MSFVSYNGKLVDAGTPLLTADNGSFKWGDGLFETIKVVKGNICLQSYHLERLQAGLDTLGIKYSNTFSTTLEEEINALCLKNNCSKKARVRLAVYRNNEGWAETIIQATPLPMDVDRFNELGWKMDIYTGIVKAVDALANLKTASYLPYIMAASHARYIGLDECILLNHKGGICDGSKTNIFLIKQGNFYTPALEEGCVAGVMRRHIIEFLNDKGVSVQQTLIPVDTLYEADEVFVTNALIGIKWAEVVGSKKYKNDLVSDLNERLLNS